MYLSITSVHWKLFLLRLKEERGYLPYAIGIRVNGFCQTCCCSLCSLMGCTFFSHHHHLFFHSSFVCHRLVLFHTLFQLLYTFVCIKISLCIDQCREGKDTANLEQSCLSSSFFFSRSQLSVTILLP